MQVGGARRHMSAEKFTPHFVIRGNHLSAAVILIDTHYMRAVTAAGFEHFVKVGEDAPRFFLGFGHTVTRRGCVDHFSRHTVHEIGRAFVAGGE